MKRIHIAAGSALTVLVGFAAATAAYAALRLRAADRLGRSGVPFDRQAQAEGARLLVVGDSTAVGAGASAPGCSLPGLLSRANPSLSVVHRGEPGAGFEDTLAQLAGDERFDAVLVLVGARDVLRLASGRRLRDSVQRVAQRARLHAEVVVFMPPGNLGNAAFVLPPWNWCLGLLSRRLDAMVGEVAQANGAQHVSMFRSRDDDPFARHPKRLHASDGLHPSDAGYELWQRELEIQAQLSARLRRIGRSAASRSSSAF